MYADSFENETFLKLKAAFSAVRSSAIVAMAIMAP